MHDLRNRKSVLQDTKNVKPDKLWAKGEGEDLLKPMNCAATKPNTFNMAMNTCRLKSVLMTSRTIYSTTTFYSEYWVQTIYQV